MFGRMFGSKEVQTSDRSTPEPIPSLPSSSSDPKSPNVRSPSAAESTSPQSSRAGPSRVRSPMSERPSPFERASTSETSQPTDVFGQIQPVVKSPDKRKELPVLEKAIDPPLIDPPVVDPPNQPRQTSHTRQPASSSPETAKTFTDSLAGMFDGIGQSEPAKELGLPPDSLRIRRGSGDQRNALGRAALAPSPSHRTSSLPATRLEPPVQIRTSSSPTIPQATEKEDAPSIRLVSPRPESIAAMPENDEEKGRRLACEFLEGDTSHVAADKVAICLGGPYVFALTELIIDGLSTRWRSSTICNTLT